MKWGFSPGRDAMHAKRVHSAVQPRRIILPFAFRCALTILLCSVASVAFAQSSAPAPTGNGNVNGNAARESSRTAALVNAGRIVFNQRCEICHFSESTAKKIGPGLKGLFARAKFVDGTKVSNASVADVIGKGSKDMPGYEGVLKPGQVQALIAYLKTR
jgi:cytochrome c